MNDMADKKADLAGPGIGTYEEVERILPADYRALQSPLERMKALYAAKDYIDSMVEEGHLEEDTAKRIFRLLDDFATRR